ncbi:DUF2330 domain-containing protein [Actinomadura sp. HBU206391]|uniref:DUF2330 domain-containing protein n=1 Tax=Actinomadura sp. HBU206391 TaxID=2731692 RepID=UPI00164F6A6A|nr:DUF2330 domain-containing protein [Actinomadura sp. HBU206391]MBC6463046.1 DUF2330 domain-containing protein [Actinomadura sp. HBU206391]
MIALLAAWTGAALVQPSWACGCGAFVGHGGSSGIDVADETSIVRFDDRAGTEQIVLRMSVRSEVRDAGWLFPTPSAAQVRLGDRAWFRELDRLTEPRVVRRRTWFPQFGDGAGAGAPQGGSGGVSVLGEKHLGPFTVATLAADDSAALANWLKGNGYRLSPGLGEALAPYVAMGWKYVAVKLDPGAGQTVSGELDPLHVSFRTRELVYPMRLSQRAKSMQSVHLYVLAPHRVARVASRAPQDEIPFAGWIDPAQVSSPGLRQFLGGRVFLTEALNRHLPPRLINDDFHYRYTADTPYRETTYETEVVRLLGVPAGLILLPAGAVLLAVVVITPIVVLRSRPRRPAA